MGMQLDIINVALRDDTENWAAKPWAFENCLWYETGNKGVNSELLEVGGNWYVILASIS